MNTIWKFELPNTVTHLEMRKDAVVLSVGNQGDNIMIWAKVETNGVSEKRSFMIIGTGWDIDEVMQENNIFQLVKLIGRVEIDWMIFHIFEVK